MSEKLHFSTRPNAGKGLWVFFLLPTALLLCLVKHPAVLTHTYRLLSPLISSLFLSSSYLVVKHYQNKPIAYLNPWIYMPFVASYSVYLWYSALLHTWFSDIVSGVVASAVFVYTYLWLLHTLKKSFTFGEAGLIAQAFTLFLYQSFVNVITFSSFKHSNMQNSTLVIQVGLTAILLLAYIAYKFNLKSPKVFYILTGLVCFNFILLPLHWLLEQSPLVWIYSQVVTDTTLLKIFLYWSCCVAVAVLAISNQVLYAQKASTSTRKVFHVLAVLVYVPGLYLRCTFLYLASGVALGVFLFFEIIRLLQMPPLARQLQGGYEVFRDEKDTGSVALTPIYLLVGVSLPIWLHPSPCDVTDSAQFNLLPLLAGLSSIGVGDTAASFIGSKFGKVKWKGSSKTLEGTLACIFSQLGFFYFLHFLGLLSHLSSEIVVGVVVGSLVEAKTTQIDNLVLPLVMFVILI